MKDLTINGLGKIIMIVLQNWPVIKLSKTQRVTRSTRGSFDNVQWYAHSTSRRSGRMACAVGREYGCVYTTLWEQSLNLTTDDVADVALCKGFFNIRKSLSVLGKFQSLLVISTYEINVFAGQICSLLEKKGNY